MSKAGFSEFSLAKTIVPVKCLYDTESLASSISLIRSFIFFSYQAYHRWYDGTISGVKFSKI